MQWIRLFLFPTSFLLTLLPTLGVDLHVFVAMVGPSEALAAHRALVQVLLGVGLDVAGQLVAPRELFVARREMADERALVLVPHDVRLEM